MVRASSGDVDLQCGGKPMTAMTEARDPDAVPDADLATGSAIGKRYADEELGLEILVTKAGAGTISIGRTPMELKEAKPLPSSD
ncbi:MAG: hypothetical protein JWM34_1050 [Ilumatobacteraceae bacterium]|nr:hypothetical protein [Ilumatobacteraceae bacterium]